MGQVGAGKILLKSDTINLIQTINFIDPAKDRCFLAGTPILMADDTEKPIEDIVPGDVVMAFDPVATRGLGPSSPKRVRRVFQNITKTVLDLRGLEMTPGHVVLSDNGEWLTIAAVLKADRALVEDRSTGPVLVRARTGRVIGSDEDLPVLVTWEDPQTGRLHRAEVRAGIPAIARVVEDRTELWTLGRVLAHQGYRLEPSGEILDASGRRFHATPWPGSTPFDAPIMHDWIISVDGIAWVPDWIADLSAEDERQAVNETVHGPVSTRAPSMTRNRRERRRLSALRIAT